MAENMVKALTAKQVLQHLIWHKRILNGVLDSYNKKGYHRELQRELRSINCNFAHCYTNHRVNAIRILANEVVNEYNEIMGMLLK